MRKFTVTRVETRIASIVFEAMSEQAALEKAYECTIAEWDNAPEEDYVSDYLVKEA